MPGGLFTPIPAPQNRQATTGLIALATAATDVPDTWEAGFKFDPESCSPGQVLAIECASSEAKTDSVHPGIVSYEPAALVVVDSCTTMDRGRDGQGLARRLLLSRQSALLEGVFWTGVAVGDTDSSTARPHLADGRATVLAGGTAVALGHGMALIDQALTGCLGGVPGMIHMAPYTLARLVQLGTGGLSLEGGRWFTPNRHLVVAGAGYTGGAPRPTVGGALPAAPNLLANPAVDQWVYGTPAVQYLLGSVDVQETIDRAINDVDVIAERAAAAFYGCCQYAVQLDTSTV